MSCPLRSLSTASALETLLKRERQRNFERHFFSFYRAHSSFFTFLAAAVSFIICTLLDVVQFGCTREKRNLIRLTQIVKQKIGLEMSIFLLPGHPVLP